MGSPSIRLYKSNILQNLNGHVTDKGGRLLKVKEAEANEQHTSGNYAGIHMTFNFKRQINT